MRHQQGFTLLELIIVVAIVGVMAGVAMLSIPGANFDDQLERETRKIAAQISLLQDEAIVQSREFGVGVWQNGYRFWGWNNSNGWQPLSDDLDFKEHILPDGNEMELSLAGQPFSLLPVPAKGFPAPKAPKSNAVISNQVANPSTRAATNTPPAPDFRHNLPPIILYSSGEASTFEMQLHHPEAMRSWNITGDIIGQLKISSKVTAE